MTLFHLFVNFLFYSTIIVRFVVVSMVVSMDVIKTHPFCKNMNFLINFALSKQCAFG